MRKTVRQAFQVLFAALVLSLTTAQQAPAAVLRIATSERVGKASTSRSFAPLLKHLNAFGKNQYQFENASAPEVLYEDFRSGKIDIALLGPVHYVRAHHEFGAVPIVADGPKYNSVIVVKADSPIRTVDDLRGKSFAFGYSGSTSSHLYPLLLLSRARLKETDLGHHEFVGSHELVIESVLSGKFEAGGVIAAAFESSRSKGLRAIATSDLIPAVPFVVRKDVDKEAVDEFRRAMLAWKPQNPEPGDAVNRGATPVTDNDYNQIRFLCKVVLGEVYK